MKTKEVLIKEMEAMVNTFKFVKMEDWQIDSMLDKFELVVELYQGLVNDEDYKLSSKENDLLEKIIK